MQSRLTPRVSTAFRRDFGLATKVWNFIIQVQQAKKQRAHGSLAEKSVLGAGCWSSQKKNAYYPNRIADRKEKESGDRYDRHMTRGARARPILLYYSSSSVTTLLGSTESGNPSTKDHEKNDSLATMARQTYEYVELTPLSRAKKKK